MAKIGIIGCGAWGTGLAIYLCGRGHDVTLWSAVPAEIAMLREEHRHKSLAGAVVPEEIRLTEDLGEAARDKDFLIMAVASSYVRQTARRLAPHIPEGRIIVDVAKGLERDSLLTLSEVIASEIPQATLCVLSGPSHAEEVSLGLPTTVVVAGKDPDAVRFVQEAVSGPVFRAYSSTDVRGVELGGALKNVIALAAGIADGLGYGDNTKAALITRGIAEMSRLGAAAGGRAETFSGLSGIGDLIVTCASMHSRNRRAGILIGQGRTCDEAMREVGQVVEGVFAAKAGLQLAEKCGVEMPIITQVNAVLFDGKSPREAVAELMMRDSKPE
ncbi:MAG: NAD(P)-dependent glycerol-3-phosphate dehydrogenase [Lachnospiraceae bacterium]|nr:NAD(P)-dependent glycerol-3-phosphate dehydrogenase [Lachnospiraceae bacterium]